MNVIKGVDKCGRTRIQFHLSIIQTQIWSAANGTASLKLSGPIKLFQLQASLIMLQVKVVSLHKSSVGVGAENRFRMGKSVQSV